MAKTNFFWMIAALLALASCSDSNSPNAEDPGGDSKVSTILQTNKNLVFVKWQAIPASSVDFISTEFYGTMSPGAFIMLKTKSVNDISELYLQAEGENGYYVWKMSAEDLVSSDEEGYLYAITFSFSLELNAAEGVQFMVTGKAKSVSNPSSSSGVSSSGGGGVSSSGEGGGSSSSYTILQSEDLVFMSGQTLPENTVNINSTEFEGAIFAGASVTLKVVTAKEITEFYLQIEGENGYYARQISAADLVSSETGSYEYSIVLKFAPVLNGTGSLRFIMSGKAK
ncbi:MAG: hypothetical protein FWC26_03030 [Fibromonadales bacterium]|nr:hypothetical protein [Fibromonadales bacterium]